MFKNDLIEMLNSIKGDQKVNVCTDPDDDETFSMVNDVVQVENTKKRPAHIAIVINAMVK